MTCYSQRIYKICHLLPDKNRKCLTGETEAIYPNLLSIIHVWLACLCAQLLSGSTSWRQRLWCRHQVTVESCRRGPKRWPHKPPTPLQDARTPTARHCRRGNCPLASPDAYCRRRACGWWMRRGNAAHSGDGGGARAVLAGGSWSKNDLRKRRRKKKRFGICRSWERSIVSRCKNVKVKILHPLLAFDTGLHV